MSTEESTSCKSQCGLAYLLVQWANMRDVLTGRMADYINILSFSPAAKRAPGIVGQRISWTVEDYNAIICKKPGYFETQHKQTTPPQNQTTNIQTAKVPRKPGEIEKQRSRLFKWHPEPWLQWHTSWFCACHPCMGAIATWVGCLHRTA